MENFKQKLTRIKTLLFDVDGVLTNGQVFLMENGEFVRNMNSKDGYGVFNWRMKFDISVPCEFPRLKFEV